LSLQDRDLFFQYNLSAEFVEENQRSKFFQPIYVLRLPIQPFEEWYLPEYQPFSPLLLEAMHKFILKGFMG
jgi:hypothetical protein